MHTQQRHGRRWFQAPMSLRTANSCPDFDMEVKIWTALGIVGAQSVRRRRMITPESPTAACGGNAQMKKITGVYMPNIGGIIKSLQNIMRKDQGVSGDAQRIEQLGWMVTLKILDDKEAENPAGVFGTV